MGLAALTLRLFATLRSGRPAFDAREGRTGSWVARLAGDGNRWLLAGRLEEQNELAAAHRVYLDDATWQAARGLYARAALSYVAAVRMAVRLEDALEAREALERAATCFRLHAEGAARWSLREVLWAYERSAALYDAAGLPVEASEMRRHAAVIDVHLHLSPVSVEHGFEVLRNRRTEP